MSCKDLQIHFDAQDRPNDLAKLVDDHAPDCVCEKEKVSGHNGCLPVSDEEHLLRIVLRPRDSKEGPPATFEETFILPITGTGFSVLRESQASADEILKLANTLANKAAEALPPTEVAEVIGIVRFPAKLARQQTSRDAKRRLICVYATPEPDFPSHADLLMAVNQFASRGKCKKVAFEFSELLEGHFVKATDFSAANIAGIRLDGRKTAS